MDLKRFEVRVKLPNSALLEFFRYQFGVFVTEIAWSLGALRSCLAFLLRLDVRWLVWLL